jgi:NAD(P)-dependent dehydrogenase (short-subunit alcohol dehydrogenase family)
MSMSFTNKIVVIPGGTGVVGSGLTRRFLDAGARVVVVSRTEANLSALRQKIAIADSEPFVGVVGSFADEAAAARAKQAVDAAVQGAAIDHVISNLGFVKVDQAPTATKSELLRAALDEGVFTNLHSAKVFVPALRDREGSSFTFVSGGLAHIPPPMPGLWMGTVKNAAVNALMLALAGETKDSKVRVNGVCIHFSVATKAGEKNQFGVPAEGDSVRLAGAFLGVAGGTRKGELVCLHTWADADRVAGG